MTVSNDDDLNKLKAISRIVAQVLESMGAAIQPGMTTAEYAVGTVAACGFGGILYKLLTSDAVQKLLKDVIERALTLGF